VEKGFRQIKLEVYQRVFQDETVHSEVEGHDRNLSAAATDKEMR